MASFVSPNMYTEIIPDNKILGTPPPATIHPPATIPPPLIMYPRADIPILPIGNLIVGAKSKLQEDILRGQGKRFEISKQIGNGNTNKGYKPVSVIVYDNGILFTGEDTFLGAKTGNKIWKHILFGNITGMKVFADQLQITCHIDSKDHIYTFRPEFKELESKPDNLNSYKIMSTWNEFLCFLANKTTRSKIHASLQEQRAACAKPPFDLVHNPLAKAGGKRKTKRSKRSKRTRRNKKCKRRTRRS